MEFSFAFALEILPKLLRGAVVTIEATLVGFLLAILVGAGLTALRRGTPRLVSGVTRWVMEFLRSTPLLVKAYFLYFALPDFGLTMAPFVAGVVALGLHHGAFASEIMRAGLDSVPRSQREAAIALNLPEGAWRTRILIPQAARPVLPGFGNLFISMLKDTPVLYSISLAEMMFVANEIGSLQFRYNEAYIVVALIYLVFSLLGAVGVRLLERRMTLPGSRP
ncbi:ectoine/hydroxyectoine ABC transporter permease subunit EhuD [Acuticoccus mangrovi]|uniref:Ectoine/hydroxyectoine ABC transporter permease subunit EhuD n=1 Tax=Acuticoccus mangrovi TaxID=2796142 RepID=A0A934MLP7_9HYPH|nr:ectoine/hydroxyectoine ABC transporter permease subunit EhuD [Acuticoccus mangrovi]MBJ3776564.1 ectoine/hydroxyectoine ABC transporter permease subunit EhuD [Acuticoccus mangrovi]